MEEKKYFAQYETSVYSFGMLDSKYIATLESGKKAILRIPYVEGKPSSNIMDMDAVMAYKGFSDAIKKRLQTIRIGTAIEISSRSNGHTDIVIRLHPEKVEKVLEIERLITEIQKNGASLEEQIRSATQQLQEKLSANNEKLKENKLDWGDARAECFGFPKPHRPKKRKKKESQNPVSL